MIIINKKITAISIISVIACVLYSLLQNSDFNYWFLSAIKIILFLIVPAFYLKLSKISLKSLIKVRGTDRYLKLSVFLGLLVLIIIFAFYIILIDLIDKEKILFALKKEGIDKFSFPFVFANIVFLNAFSEEFFFRGFMFLTLYKSGFRKYAYIFSSLLFAFYHISIIDSMFSAPLFILCLIGLIIAGLLFNEIDRRCGNILGGYFIHFGANLAINTIGVYMIYF